MEIIQIPPNYASLRTPLIYTFSDSASRTFEFRIVDNTTGKAVGVKRFVGVTQASFDAAPYLRRCLRIKPEAGPTGFISTTGRCVEARVEVDNTTSPVRTFIAGEGQTGSSEFISSRFGARLIGVEDYDELMAYTTTPCKINITARTQGEATVTSYTAPTAGLNIFRVSAAEFVEAESFTVDIVGVASIRYSFVDYRAGRRVAWRTNHGSIEHYTFPIERELDPEVTREQILTDHGVEGVAVRFQLHALLISAYEPSRMLTPLVEILTSPQVWWVEKGLYTPIEVVAKGSGLRDHDSLRNLELEILHQPKTLQL